MTTSEIADELNQNKWNQKIDGSPITAFQIHGNHIASKKQKVRKDSDENYVIDLSDKVLGLKSSRQTKFDFL